MPTRLTRLLLPLSALFCLSTTAADAVPAGCERVAQASIATLTAPRYHQRVSGQGAEMELLRVDERVWQRIGGTGWKLSKMGPAAFERAAHKAGAVLARCERTGSDRIDGVATEVWRVTTRALGGEPPTVSQMWIGAADGRTYRNSGAGVESTVRYQGVEPPQ
ncbi:MULTISPECIES: hypothetical protein [unclassified Roseateles]|uniref:hypothetical protein n=1 Tax=unclassified Roseateles TaxID=2626991 RepID=UPI0006F8D795|nr:MULTISPECIES: hypothetical protein [unclassified Roseateles]